MGLLFPAIQKLEWACGLHVNLLCKVEDLNRMNILQLPPKVCDPSALYLFYLHGLIIEVAGIRPKSEEHGYYEYEQILAALARCGFIVISEARSKNTQVSQYAGQVVAQINGLLGSGVPPGNITVVGASKGGIIGSYVSAMLKNRDINYVLLAGLFEKCLVDEDLKLYGRVLSIHDRSDTLSIVPDRFFQRSEGLGRFEKIVLELDLGHGLIYQPYLEWLEPLCQWVKGG